MQKQGAQGPWKKLCPNIDYPTNDKSYTSEFVQFGTVIAYYLTQLNGCLDSDNS